MKIKINIFYSWWTWKPLTMGYKKYGKQPTALITTHVYKILLALGKSDYAYLVDNNRKYNFSI